MSWVYRVDRDVKAWEVHLRFRVRGHPLWLFAKAFVPWIPEIDDEVGECFSAAFAESLGARGVEWFLGNERAQRDWIDVYREHHWIESSDAVVGDVEWGFGAGGFGTGADQSTGLGQPFFYVDEVGDFGRYRPPDFRRCADGSYCRNTEDCPEPHDTEQHVG